MEKVKISDCLRTIDIMELTYFRLYYIFSPIIIQIHLYHIEIMVFRPRSLWTTFVGSIWFATNFAHCDIFAILRSRSYMDNMDPLLLATPPQNSNPQNKLLKTSHMLKFISDRWTSTISVNHLWYHPTQKVCILNIHTAHIMRYTFLI